MGFVESLAWGILTVLLLMALCVIVETIVPKDRYPLTARLRGALFYSVMIMASVLISYPLGKAVAALGLGPILPPLDQWAGPLAIPVSLLALDFLRYWEHRFEHRFMWPVHAVHHSPEELHAANSYGHPLQAIPIFFLVSVPFSFLNFSSASTPAAVGLLMGFMLLFIHSSSDIHLGPLRHVFVDNRFHRIHHSTEEQHFDRNFGNIFTIWDRLFGTTHFPASDEWPSVGVKEYPQPRTLRQFLLLPLHQSYPAVTDTASAGVGEDRRCPVPAGSAVSHIAATPEPFDVCVKNPARR